MGKRMKARRVTLKTELLILPDGRILVQNLTQPMAELLRQLNPHDQQIAPRAGGKAVSRPVRGVPPHPAPLPRGEGERGGKKSGATGRI